jgi:membrane-associated phospholipid phosphatase
MATGSLAAGYWNAVADTLISNYHLPESEAAHVLALANTAAWDANVACHDTKYAYWLPRPTQVDPQITLAIGLPNHPSYPSNHACVSGTAAEILAASFPSEAADMRARAQEAMMSRVYAGVHYRFDGEAGLEIARRVSAFALAQDAALAGVARAIR